MRGYGDGANDLWQAIKHMVDDPLVKKRVGDWAGSTTHSTTDVRSHWSAPSSIRQRPLQARTPTSARGALRTRVTPRLRQSPRDDCTDGTRSKCFVAFVDHRRRGLALSPIPAVSVAPWEEDARSARGRPPSPSSLAPVPHFSVAPRISPHVTKRRSAQVNHRVERLPAVLARTGMSRSALYAAVRSQSFPSPIKLSARSVGFLTEEVDAWIVSRAAQRA